MNFREMLAQMQVASLRAMFARKQLEARSEQPKQVVEGRKGVPLDQQRAARRRRMKDAMQMQMPGYWAHQVGPNRKDRRASAQFVQSALDGGTNRQPKVQRNARGKRYVLDCLAEAKSRREIRAHLRNIREASSATAVQEAA